MIRKPAVEDMFYEGNLEKLDLQIKKAFLGERGPGTLPTKKRDERIKGAIVPHAGYSFSSEATAWAYKAIGEAKPADTYIILGVNHSGIKTCISENKWETPFGIIQTDKEFIEQLTKNIDIEIDESAHQFEHSIEVQLPFLQFVNKDCIKDLKIVPIMVSQDIDPKELGKAIKKTIGNQNICVIASGDFTHYGPNFGFTPFPTSSAKLEIKKLDKQAIELIINNNPKELLEFIEESEATICGTMPFAVLLYAIEFKQAFLQQYYTSGDISGDYTNAVGYASIIFR